VTGCHGFCRLSAADLVGSSGPRFEPRLVAFVSRSAGSADLAVIGSAVAVPVSSAGLPLAVPRLDPELDFLPRVAELVGASRLADFVDVEALLIAWCAPFRSRFQPGEQQLLPGLVAGQLVLAAGAAEL
jgi:hypothetical protein